MRSSLSEVKERRIESDEKKGQQKLGKQTIENSLYFSKNGEKGGQTNTLIYTSKHVNSFPAFQAATKTGNNDTQRQPGSKMEKSTSCNP